MQLKYDSSGLIVAVCQDYLDGSILMVAWMNVAAVEKTIETRRATFYSRSRQQLWVKGETSGNVLHVESVHVDCDGDTLLLRVRPEGPACHTGQPTCFFSPYPAGEEAQAVPNFLDGLERELELRKSSSGTKSYTKSLLEAGPAKIESKLVEESREFCQALGTESEERVASEAADVLYHLLVGLRLRSVSVRRVFEHLAARTSMSGHEEKSRRGSTDKP